MTTDIRQVIVMRKDLKMRRGKEIAQGAHASIAFMTNAVRPMMQTSIWRDELEERGLKEYSAFLTDEQTEWIRGLFTKICLQVNSEEELLAVHGAAQDAGLTCHLIKDAGLTEFDGIATYTCCAIGPHAKEKIDPITKDLKLY